MHLEITKNRSPELVKRIRITRNINPHAYPMLTSKKIRPRLIRDLIDFNGADERTRTADLLITNQSLYHLSYAGTAIGPDIQPITELLNTEDRPQSSRSPLNRSQG